MNRTPKIQKRGGDHYGPTPPTEEFSSNHPVGHIQKPRLAKLYVMNETCTSYSIIYNQFVK